MFHLYQTLTISPAFFVVSYCAVNRFPGAQERFQSSYVGNFARRVRDVDGAGDAAFIKELRNDPEAVIRLFESQPSLHSNPSAVAEYVKALVRVDRLGESELFKTLQRGGCGNRVSLFLITYVHAYHIVCIYFLFI